MAKGWRFTGTDRQLGDEDRIQLTSIGIDIGSSTSHLVFSCLELERADNCYLTVSRTIRYQSPILLTPYIDGMTIDGSALGRFIERQYQAASLRPEDIDTGALILTGVALLRENARAIGELFAQEAGRFVVVSAGDHLEATMAAYGSGAVALSEHADQALMNVDVGGGTTKLAVCSQGKVRDVAAMDVGARLVVWDGTGVITRLEAAGRRIGKAVGLDLHPGHPVDTAGLKAMAAFMADRLVEAMGLASLTAAARALMRTRPLTYSGPLRAVTFSGGVSEFFYGREANQFGDMGQLLAVEIRARVARTGLQVLEPAAGIRATVIGASQYTVQVSGSTIFLSPLSVVPIRNIPVVTPELALGEAEIDPAAIRRAVRRALRPFGLLNSESPVALALRWDGSATFARVDAFCRGIIQGLSSILAHGHPVVLVCDGDVGGLFGIHLKEEMRLSTPVISIDGVELREFDYIDIGSLIPASGAVPVVIKSLVFPPASPG